MKPRIVSTALGAIPLFLLLSVNFSNAEIHRFALLRRKVVFPRRYTDNCQLLSCARNSKWRSCTVFGIPRGGSTEEEEDDEDSEVDEDEESESEEEEDEEEQEESSVESGQDEESSVQIEINVEKYDEPLVASPMINLYASIGAMMLGRRVDLFDPKVARLIRAAYVLYIIVHQAFLFYVRIKARSIDDRTPIELKNPFSSVLQSQLDQSGTNSMVKSLASSFLSSKSTVKEYDMKQARSMQGNVIFSLVFLYFLHFRMGQVQPFLISTVTGIATMIYSPLFQVYVMGRNLERPFENPMATRLQERQNQEEEEDEREEEEEAHEGEADEENNSGEAAEEEAGSDEEEEQEEEAEEEEEEEEGNEEADSDAELPKEEAVDADE